MQAYSFRPRIWAVLLTLLLAAGMTTAGFWQYGRGVQKQTLQAERASQVVTSAEPLLGNTRTPPRGEVRKIFVEGRYAAERTVRLDNQPRKQVPGVHAWTPLLLANGQSVIVDRGWLPLDAPVTAPPVGVQRVEGYWRTLPRAGMQLGARPAGCTVPRPELVNYPDFAQVQCLFGTDTLDGLLELDAAAPGGFKRDWAFAGANEIPPARHFGYAAQWWLFAVTLIVLFIKINLKKTPSHP